MIQRPKLNKLTYNINKEIYALSIEYLSITLLIVITNLNDLLIIKFERYYYAVLKIEILS